MAERHGNAADAPLGNRFERFFNKIKHTRRVTARFEERASNDLAMLKLAAIRAWLHHNVSLAWGLGGSARLREALSGSPEEPDPEAVSLKLREPRNSW